jgi:hypothetical protein
MTDKTTRAREIRRALSDYRCWHQNRREHRFQASEPTNHPERTARENRLAEEAEVKLELARTRYVELTGREPTLW